MTDRSTRLTFTNLLGETGGDIRFMLDNSVFLKQASNGLEIIGWAVHRKFEIVEVNLSFETEILATSKLDIFRPRVSQHFGEFHNSDSAGFKLTTNTLPIGKLLLEALLGNGKKVALAELELVKYEQSKLLFMHIPKAAGSTVNAFFSSHYAKDCYAVHIESNQKWQSSPDDLRKLHFLSGHIALHSLQKKLNLDDYYNVTVIREPYEQLCSHLLWIRRLASPEEKSRFTKHPVYIQKFALKLANIDFTNPLAIEEQMGSLEDAEMRLVDNCQVRYFVWVPSGEAVSSAHSGEAIRASRVFKKIGTTDQIGFFLKDVANKMSWPEPNNIVRENVTQNFYGFDTSDPKIRAVLEPYFKHDMVLYDHVRALDSH